MARTPGSRSAATGPKIRQSALRLFATQGYAAVSMRKIAADVGVQAGALYNYIPDKQALLFDLMRQHMLELLAARAAQKPADTPMQALEDFTRFHIRFHLDRPDAVFIAYMELRNLTEENFAQIENLRSQYEDELMEILKAGQAAGIFEVAERKVAMRAVIAMLTGVTTWYRDSGRLDRSEVEELYWTMVKNAVRAR